MADHFTVLEIPPAFDVDLPALEAAYFAQQRKFHPDRFVGKPPAERQAALQRSVDINNAYNALRNPLTRSQFLLQQHGIAVGTEVGSVKPSMELLGEVMEWREAAEEATEMAQLDKLSNLLSMENDNTMNGLSNAFKSRDWQVMAQASLRLGYIIKTQDEIRQRKLRLKNTP